MPLSTVVNFISGGVKSAMCSNKPVFYGEDVHLRPDSLLHLRTEFPEFIRTTVALSFMIEGVLNVDGHARSAWSR